MALANAQKQNGKTDLAAFRLDKSIKKISDILETTWAIINNATNLIVRQQKTRFHILSDSMNCECDESCDGQWLTKCLDTLDKNNIVRDDFSDALFNLINFGRSKYCNLMLRSKKLWQNIPHKTTAKQSITVSRTQHPVLLHRLVQRKLNSSY